MRTYIALLLLTLIGLTGCVAPTKYDWGSYESSLYSYYKDPAKIADLSKSLADTISTAEKTNKPVPPGVYAEYGFILHQQGKSSEAVPFFEKEKSKWPESTALMDSMIKMASRSTKSEKPL